MASEVRGTEACENGENPDSVEKSPFPFSPALLGIASIAAGCLAFAIVWVIFNQGPDGPLNNNIGRVAVWLPLVFGLACGLLGIGAGINQRNWLGCITGAVGLVITGYGAALVIGS